MMKPWRHLKRAKPCSLIISSDDSDITSSVFSGNSSASRAGGIHNENASSNITNCSFIGNVGDLGGALSVQIQSYSILNSTFSLNKSNKGGALYVRFISEQSQVKNSVMYNDTVGEFGFYEADDETTGINVSYSDVAGWAGGGAGNLNTNPTFIGNPWGNGTFSSTIYNADTYQTELQAAAATWSASSLKGRFVQPDKNDDRYFLIHDNTDDTIYVWGDLVTLLDLAGNESFQLFDPRLNPETSSCVDAATGTGAPEKDIDGNTRSATAVDMGAYEAQ